MPLGALDPQTWPFHLAELPAGSYLVGGAVRDALLDRTNPKLDLDFVVPQAALDTARAIARRYQAGFVVLDAERGISRLVFPQATVDFAQQDGANLETDLSRRDFTINAIAYNPQRQIFIDPLGGQQDLQARCLRMVREQNLREDPLRLLRAYRQAAQLEFQLDPQTQASLQQLAPLLAEVSAERVLSELMLLLELPQGSAWLGSALADGLFATWLPSADPMVANDLMAIDQAVETLSHQYPPSRSLWRAVSPGQPRSAWVLAKLTALLAADPQQAAHELEQLKASRWDCRAVAQLRYWQQACVPPLSLHQQADLFDDLGDRLPALVLLLRVTQPHATTELLERYLCPTDRVAHPQPLIDGQVLMAQLQLRPGPAVGRLLQAVRYAQAEGRVGDRPQALALAATMLAQGQKLAGLQGDP
jgi:tRNA nucleotidyltransferase (CCA-adding enzyme)